MTNAIPDEIMIGIKRDPVSLDWLDIRGGNFLFATPTALGVYPFGQFDPNQGTDCVHLLYKPLIGYMYTIADYACTNEYRVACIIP